MKYHFSEFWITREDNKKQLYLTRFESEISEAKKHILLAHGLTYAQFVFDIKYKDYSLCEYFARNGYNVWRLDIGGYGKSEKYENGWEVTTENAARDLIRAMEEICRVCQVESMDLLGWSWGTMVTAKAVSLRPELVKHMIWIGPCFGGMFPPVQVEEPFIKLDDTYINRIWQRYPDMLEKGINYHTVEPALQNMWMVFAYTQKGGMLRPGGGAKEIMEAGDDWLIHPEEIKTPVLILVGDHDFYTNVKRCYKALEKLPKGSDICFLSGAGHAMYLEKDYYRQARETMLRFIEGKN